MANFRMEGQGNVTGTHDVTWMVEPIASPDPWRQCSGCGEHRPFVSSGKIRLNANGRRLDAWLIYRCIACDRSWNRPLVERVAVSSVSEADLRAMQQSDRDWVRRQVFDLVSLRRHCSRVDLHSDFVVKKFCPQPIPLDWSTIALDIAAPLPTGVRLDRLLSNELPISRSGLHAMYRRGGLEIGLDSSTSLKKAVFGHVTVWFLASKLADEQRVALASMSFA
jgi:hypothetical protein